MPPGGGTGKLGGWIGPPGGGTVTPGSGTVTLGGGTITPGGAVLVSPGSGVVTSSGWIVPGAPAKRLVAAKSAAMPVIFIFIFFYLSFLCRFLPLTQRQINRRKHLLIWGVTRRPRRWPVCRLQTISSACRCKPRLFSLSSTHLWRRGPGRGGSMAVGFPSAPSFPFVPYVPYVPHVPYVPYVPFTLPSL